MVSRVAAACLAGVLLARAGGEVVRMEKKVLSPLSVEGFQLVYAFSSSPEESPLADVSFEDFRLSIALGDNGTGPYGPVSVALIPWDRFAALTEWTSLCSSGSVDLGEGVAQLGLNVNEVHAKRTSLSPGIYAATIMNCGSSGGLLVSGTISVKNTHGFSGGNDSSRVLIYGAFAVVLVIGTVAWACVSNARSASASSVHEHVTHLSLAALASSIAWLVTFYHENESGEAPLARLFAEACAGVKMMHSVIFVLYAALGSGVTKYEMGSSVDRSIVFLAALSGVAAVRLVHVLEERQALATATQSLLHTVVPCAAVVAAVSLWTFWSLAVTIRRCKDTNQVSALAHFHKMTFLVIMACLVFLLAFAVQILEQPGTVMPNHIFWQDILVNLIFCASLFGIMYMYVPDQGAFAGDTYAPHVEDEEQATECVEAGTDDDDHDILADESGKPSGTGPSATTIGTNAAAE